MKHLVLQGANANVKDKSRMSYSNISLVVFLRKNHADPSLLDNIGSSALIHVLLQFEAGEEGEIRPVVKLMHERGVPRLISNKDGISAKSIAIAKGFHHVVTLIEEYSVALRTRRRKARRD